MKQINRVVTLAIVLSGLLLPPDSAQTHQNQNVISHSLESVAYGNREGASSTEQTSQLDRRLAADVARLPSAARPVVDVVGVKLGVSTAAASRDALRQFQPALDIQEERWTAGGIADGKSVSRLVARRVSPGSNSPKDVIVLMFSIPSEGGKATYIARSSTFDEADAPSYENLMSNLRSKYGEPFIQLRHEAETDMAWAWDPDGRQLALSDRHPCAQRGGLPGNGDLNFAKAESDRARTMLLAGCSAAIHASVNFNRNKIVRSMNTLGVDIFTLFKSVEAAQRQMAEYRQLQDDTARKRSNERPGPRL